MQDEPVGEVSGLRGEDLAGDLGVDAFVPVGEAVVAEEGEEDDGGEESGEGGGKDGLAVGEVLGFACWLVPGGHVNNIREVGRASQRVSESVRQCVRRVG